jgi:hypothetical protein
MAKPSTERPDRLHHLYEQTKNPLFVWQAIADAPAIPDWCMPYLREVAINLTELASSKHAMQSVSKALSLSRQGKRNAFAALEKDRRDMKFAKQFTAYEHSRELRFDEDLGQYFVSDNPPSFFRDIVWGNIKRERNVARDRAQRIIARGKSLLRWW